MDAVTICSDFEAQENRVFHCFPIYLLQVMGLDAMILVLNVDFEASIFSLLCHFHQEGL